VIRDGPVILDCHCHIIPAAMLTSAVPADMGSDRPVDDIRSLGLGRPDEQLMLGGNAEQLFRMAAEK
jgi:hypothetical protein